MFAKTFDKLKFGVFIGHRPLRTFLTRYCASTGPSPHSVHGDAIVAAGKFYAMQKMCS